MKKRLLSLLLAAACLMPLSGCNWGEEPEETYDTLSQYYQQSDSTKQDTRLTTFGLPYLQGETWDPITCADGAQQTLGALLYESLYTLGTDFLPQPCLAESASYDAESYALTVTVRSGITFSDGSALTAWDVVAALRRAKESVRYGQRLAEMDSVSYLGEYPPHLPHPQRPAVRRPAGHSYHQGRHSGGHGTGGQRPLPLCQGRERGVSGPANGLVAG